MKKIPFQIIKEVPEEVSNLYQDKSARSILTELFYKMRLGQVAVIRKSEWHFSTAPGVLWYALRSFEGIKGTFSSRDSGEKWYLRKVKFPIIGRSK